VPGALPRLASQRSARYLHRTQGVAWVLTAIFCVLVLGGGIAVILSSGLEDSDFRSQVVSTKRQLGYDTAPTVTAPGVPTPRGGATPRGASPDVQMPSPALASRRPSAAPPSTIMSAASGMSPSASSRITAGGGLSSRFRHPPARILVPTLRGASTGLFDVKDKDKNDKVFLQVSLITTLIKPPEEYVQLVDAEGKELGICGYYPKGHGGGYSSDFFQLHVVGQNTDEQEFSGHLIKDGASFQLIKDERLTLQMNGDPQRHFEICDSRNNVLAQVSPPAEDTPGYIVAFAHGSDFRTILLFLLGIDRSLHYEQS